MTQKTAVTRDKASTDSYGFDYPTEAIELPSGGKLYDKSNPLSGGLIDIKYMTAKEEEILASENLIDKGIVFDRLLESIVVGPPSVNVNDLIIGDKNAAFLAARILGYGASYDIKPRCPKCNKLKDRVMDLTSISTKNIDEKHLNHGNLFEFKCEFTSHYFKFKLLTHGDEVAIDRELKMIEEKTGNKPEFTTRLKYMITEVNGQSDVSTIISFINKEFLSRDIKNFRKYLLEISPGINMVYEFTCDQNCPQGGDIVKDEVSIAMGVGFFWPAD